MCAEVPICHGKNKREALLARKDFQPNPGGKLMSEQPRYVAIRDGVLNHMAHHRGQLTVYLPLAFFQE